MPQVSYFACPGFLLKNSGTGQRVTLEPGQVIDLPGQIAEKVLEKGKGRLAALPADCEGCCMEIEGMCYDRIMGHSVRRCCPRMPVFKTAATSGELITEHKG
jgi:hypothetical protein